MAEKSARILLVCKRFFQTKMRPYLAANAITIANSGIIKSMHFTLNKTGYPLAAPKRICRAVVLGGIRSF